MNKIELTRERPTRDIAGERPGAFGQFNRVAVAAPVDSSSSLPVSLNLPTSSSLSSRFWLFSAPVDLGVFLGSAVLAFIALWIGARTGVLNDRAPEWTWVPAVLLIDVAHVWGTGFRVYFDTAELKRRPWLYALVPAIGFVIGVALYSEG